jgi:hypothetical protein
MVVDGEVETTPDNGHSLNPAASTSDASEDDTREPKQQLNPEHRNPELG